MRGWLIFSGLVLLAAGLCWPLLARLRLGRLPGDIAVERPGFSFFFPITTCIAISLALSLIFWFLRK
jgi:hypothetical protein